MQSATPFSSFVMSGADLMLLLFYFLIGFYAIFTAILYYHWQSYSNNPRVTFLTLVTYFVLTIPLLITLSAVVIVT